MYILAGNNITKKGVKYLTKVCSSEILLSFIFIYMYLIGSSHGTLPYVPHILEPMKKLKLNESNVSQESLTQTTSHFFLFFVFENI